MMWKAKRLVAAGLAPGIALVVLGCAQSSAPKVDARADLLALQQQVQADRSLEFDAVIVPGGAESAEIVAKGELERPNRLRMTVSRDAVVMLDLASDGKDAIAYAPRAHEYYKCRARHDIGLPADQAYMQFIASQVGDDATQAAYDFVGMVSQANFIPSDSVVKTHSLGFSVSGSPVIVSGARAEQALLQTSIKTKSGDTDLAITRIVYTKSPLALRSCSISASANGQPQRPVLDVVLRRFEPPAHPIADSMLAFVPPSGAEEQTSEDVMMTAQIGSALRPGAHAPDFSVETAGGDTVKLSQYTGKVVVIECWATWCRPCQMELPRTDEIASKYMRRGVVFMPVCVDDSKASFRYWLLLHKHMHMTFLYDPSGQSSPGFSSELYHSDVFPTQFVIGKNGKIVSTLAGYDHDGDPNETELTKAIDKALAG